MAPHAHSEARPERESDTTRGMATTSQTAHETAPAEPAETGRSLRKKRLALQTARTFASLADACDAPCPRELLASGALDESDWSRVMERIRQGVEDRAPCIPCTSAAYGCCICTGGLSLFEYRRQLADAERGVESVLANVNEGLATHRKRVRFGLARSCCSRWIEVEYW